MYRYRDTEHIGITPVTETGGVVTIDNADDVISIQDLVADIEPIQDLHGYDKPWVGGAGKNKLQVIGTGGTSRGVTAVVGDDGVFTLSGTNDGSLYSSFVVNAEFPTKSGVSYIMNGAPTTAGITIRNVTAGVADNGNGVTFTGNGGVNRIEVRVNANTAISGSAVVKPMVRLASETEATYEPYENICPISGHTSVDTQRTGKNLFKFKDKSTTINGVSVSTNGSEITFTGTPTGTVSPYSGSEATTYANMVVDIPAGTYHASCEGFVMRDNADRIVVQVVDETNTPLTGFENGRRITPITVGGAYPNITFTTTKPMRVGVWINLTAGSAVNFTATIQLELGSTATAYEPYQGNTYTTALGRTVYGGNLEQISGLLTDGFAEAVFKTGKYLLSGPSSAYSLTYVYYNETLGGLIEKNGGNDTTMARCPYFAPTSRTLAGSGATGIFQYHDGSTNQFRIAFPREDRFSTSAKVMEWLDSLEEPLIVYYPLATPQTYQLTAQQISTLLGQNNVWASSGNIKVVYAVDLKKYVTLPKEAVSINGTYIEKILDGYSTLYVKGRESLGVELNTYSVGTANGEKVKGKRYPARVLTVGFQLLADNEAEFRQRFNQLNNLLSLDEADFVFNDETDKYFTGYPVMDASVEAGRNNVTGEWQIYCAYPFKRSVEVKTLSSTDASGVVISGSSATFTFDYNGTQPARPILRAEFASAKSGGDYTEDGDCGFVAFLDPDENIIQLGNPDVIDVDALNKNATLANSVFDAFTGWTNSGLTIADISDAYWDKGTGQTQKYARGTGTLTRTTTGAIGFEFDIVHRLCVDAPAQTGTFKAHLKNGANVIVGFEIVKTGNGTAGTVKYILNNKVVGTDTIDLSYYNTNFGYCNRTPVYVQQSYQQQVITYVKQKKKKKKKKVVSYVTKTRTVQNGWNYTQSNLNSGISRDGGVVTFSIGELADRTFKDSDIENTSVTTVLFTTTGNFHTNALRSCAFVSKKGVPFAEIPNVFTAGDIVQADCNDANVYLYRNGSADGHLEAQYGALGNDWEDFELKVGRNIIRAVWSSWVNASYKPVIKIIFNEVYI